MNTKDSDLNFSPSDSCHSPTDDTLAKAVAVDTLWTYKLVDRSMTADDENRAIRELTCNMDARSVELRDLTVTQAFVADVVSILSRSVLIKSVWLERVTLAGGVGAKYGLNSQCGLNIDLSKMPKLKQVDILGCKIDYLKLPNTVSDLGLDRCGIEASSLDMLRDLDKLAHLNIIDVNVTGNSKNTSESQVAIAIAKVLELATKIERVHSSLDFEKVSLDAKKRLLKAIAKNMSLQFISYKKAIQKSSPAKKNGLQSNAKDNSRAPRSAHNTSAKSFRNTRLFSQGKEEINWSISKPQTLGFESSIEQLQLVAETPVDPFADDGDSMNDFSSASDCDQFVEDFIDCNLRANRFIARHGIDAVKGMLENGGLPESLVDSELADVMHRLLSDKLADLSNVEQDINDLSNSSKYEDDLNQAVMQHRLITKSFDSGRCDRSKKPEVDGLDRKQKLGQRKPCQEMPLHQKPKQSLNKPFYEDTMDVGFQLHPMVHIKPIQLPVLTICPQKTASVIKNSSRQKTNRSLSSRGVKNPRRKSLIEGGVAKSKCPKPHIKPKMAVKPNKASKSKAAKTAHLRKPSVSSKPSAKLKQISAVAPKPLKYIRKKSCLKTDRSGKENCQVISNQIEKPVPKEFTFHKLAPIDFESSFKLHILRDQNIQLTEEKSVIGRKMSVVKNKQKKTTKTKQNKSKQLR